MSQDELASIQMTISKLFATRKEYGPKDFQSHLCSLFLSPSSDSDGAKIGDDSIHAYLPAPWLAATMIDKAKLVTSESFVTMLKLFKPFGEFLTLQAFLSSVEANLKSGDGKTLQPWFYGMLSPKEAEFLLYAVAPPVNRLFLVFIDIEEKKLKLMHYRSDGAHMFKKCRNINRIEDYQGQRGYLLQQKDEGEQPVFAHSLNELIAILKTGAKPLQESSNRLSALYNVGLEISTKYPSLDEKKLFDLESPPTTSEIVGTSVTCPIQWTISKLFSAEKKHFNPKEFQSQLAALFNSCPSDLDSNYYPAHEQGYLPIPWLAATMIDSKGVVTRESCERMLHLFKPFCGPLTVQGYLTHIEANLKSDDGKSVQPWFYGWHSAVEAWAILNGIEPPLGRLFLVFVEENTLKILHYRLEYGQKWKKCRTITRAEDYRGQCGYLLKHESDPEVFAPTIRELIVKLKTGDKGLQDSPTRESLIFKVAQELTTPAKPVKEEKDYLWKGQTPSEYSDSSSDDPETPAWHVEFSPPPLDRPASLIPTERPPESLFDPALSPEGDPWPRYSDIDKTSRLLHPIEGVLQAPLLSLKDACAWVFGKYIIQPKLDGLVQVSSDFAEKKIRVEDKNNTGLDSNGLTKDEIGAIHMYTGNGIYPLVNELLRSEDREKCKPLFSYLRLILAGLEKLPKIDAQVWRGIKCQIKYMEKEKIYWWGFSSCTRNLAKCQKFLGSDDRTLCEVHVIQGVDIAMYSYFQAEQEILLPPGTYLFVKAILRQGQLTIISLEQISGGRMIS